MEAGLQPLECLRVNNQGSRLDQETGTSYNYFRDYDPQIGRYAQSDPMGLRAGLSTFGYVGGNPVGSVDKYGLLRWTSTSYVTRDLKKNVPFWLFPNDPAGPRLPDAWAGGVTTAEWNIQSACTCVNGGYKFQEFTVDFRNRAKIRANLSSSLESFVVKAEYDHVTDLMRWAHNNGMKLAQNAENRYKNGAAFSSQEACESVTSDALSGLLSSGIQPAFWETWFTWDVNGYHKRGNR